MDDFAEELFDVDGHEQAIRQIMNDIGAKLCPHCRDTIPFVDEQCPVCLDLGWIDDGGEPCEP